MVYTDLVIRLDLNEYVTCYDLSSGEEQAFFSLFRASLFTINVVMNRSYDIN